MLRQETLELLDMSPLLFLHKKLMLVSRCILLDLKGKAEHSRQHSSWVPEDRAECNKGSIHGSPDDSTLHTKHKTCTGITGLAS